MRAVIPSEEQVIQWITSLSNWGRWGEDDQNGCLNLITPEKRKQAAALVQDGVTVSCARPITTEITPDITYQVQRYMVDSGEGRDTDPPERRRVRRGAAEFIGMVCHGQTITHIDALSHYSWQSTMYNGKPASLVTSREGAQSHSIEVAADGIVTRGVLLDIPQVRGVPWLPPDEPVMPDDLEAAEQQAGVRVEAGDIAGAHRQLPQNSRTGPSAQHGSDDGLSGSLYPLVQRPGHCHAGYGYVKRCPSEPLCKHRHPAPYCIPGGAGPVADR